MISCENQVSFASCRLLQKLQVQAEVEWDLEEHLPHFHLRFNKVGLLTNAVTDDFDPVQESQDGCQMQHVCNEAEYVHFKFKTDIAILVNF